jgi:hypothetical protein
MRPETRHSSSRRALDASAGGAIAGWRRELLLRAGFDTDLATCVAGDGAMDVHALIELVEAGCVPGLAVRILAPLEHERSSGR